MNALALVPKISAEDVLTYEHEGMIARLQEKEKLTEEKARVLFLDMLRFLLLCGTQEQILSPSEAIDQAWHHFILFTRDYREFCQRFFGKFVDHQPFSRSERTVKQMALEMRDRTLAVAGTVFGELSDNWLYPKTNALDCTPSTNCQEITCCAKP